MGKFISYSRPRKKFDKYKYRVISSTQPRVTLLQKVAERQSIKPAALWRSDLSLHRKVEVISFTVIPALVTIAVLSSFFPFHLLIFSQLTSLQLVLAPCYSVQLYAVP